MFVHGNTRKRGELEIYFSPHVCRGIYAKKRTFFYLGLMGVRFFVVLGYMLNILFMAHFFCVSLFAAPPPFFLLLFCSFQLLPVAFFLYRSSSVRFNSNPGSIRYEESSWEGGYSPSPPQYVAFFIFRRDETFTPLCSPLADSHRVAPTHAAGPSQRSLFL